MESQGDLLEESGQKQPEVSAADKIKELETVVSDLTGKWKRAAADYANLEKRYAREKEEVVVFANTRLLLKMLPVLDDLEKAVATHPSEGLALILRKFKTLLRSEGLEEIAAVGESFDPQIHECLEVVQGEEGKIVAVLRRGYKIGEKVLRPAQARVGQARPQGESEQAEREGAKSGDYV